MSERLRKKNQRKPGCLTIPYVPSERAILIFLPTIVFFRGISKNNEYKSRRKKITAITAFRIKENIGSNFGLKEKRRKSIEEKIAV